MLINDLDLNIMCEILFAKIRKYSIGVSVDYMSRLCHGTVWHASRLRAVTIHMQ